MDGSTFFARAAAPRRLAAVLLCMFAPAFAAQAAEWRYLEAQESKPFDPVRIVPGSNGAVWSFDSATLRRTDAAGNSAVLQRSALIGGFDDAVYRDGVATSDGGLVAFNDNCNLLRVTADLRPTWRQRPQILGCKGVRVAADGVTWVGASMPGDGDQLFQIGPDGAQWARRRPGADAGALMSMNSLADFEALSGGGNLELSHSLQNTDAILTRRNGSADIVWTWTQTNGRDRAQKLVATEDGGADVIGVIGNDLWISRIGAQGQQLYSRQLAAGAPALVAAVRAPGGALYVVTGSSTSNDTLEPQFLSRISAEGGIAWQRPFCPGPTQTPASPLLRRLVVGADGSIANLCATAQQDRLVRRDSAGGTSEFTLPLLQALELHAGEGGELLVLGRNQADAPYQTRLIGISASNQVRTVPLGNASEREALRLFAGRIDSDGASYLLTQNDASDSIPRQQYLSKVGTDGTRSWRVSLSSFDLRSVRMQVGHGLVCVTENAGSTPLPNSLSKERAFCVRTSDGSPYGVQTDNLPGFDAQIYGRQIENGQFILVRTSATEYGVELHNASGIVRTTAGSGKVTRVGIDNKGRATLAVGSNVVQYDIAGALVYQITQSELSSYTADFVANDDGSVYAAGIALGQIGTGERSLWSISPTGTKRWIKSLTLSGPQTQIVATTDAVYALQFGGSVNGSADSLLSKFNKDDGTRVWAHRSTNPTQSAQQDQGGRFAVDASGSNIALAHSWNNRLRVERLDAASGQPRPERIVDCNGLCGEPTDLQFDTAGNARLSVAVVDNSAGQTAAVYSLDKLATEAPRIRLDQPGVAGLWYSPYAVGEGLSIDWLPASGTLFGAWFTYTAIGGNDPAQQRWLTIQVNGVPANATELELPILETVGGNFNAGPPVSPQRVGTARLFFNSCSTGTLSYDFGAVKGTIALSRLTPATQPCILADGSTQPGAGARPPSKGFDARMSGAWYDEATVGQGLQLNIQPDGVFFAPWFTYDPFETGGDDPTRQHWFTLQGNLGQATNGQAEVMLIQTTGGAFDRVPTTNANIVGSATITMLGCDSARLNYRFDANRIAGPYAQRTGTLNLKRMGGCAP